MTQRVKTHQQQPKNLRSALQIQILDYKNIQKNIY